MNESKAVGTSSEAFHERLKIESALFVADAATLGADQAVWALERGVAILNSRIKQIHDAQIGKRVALTIVPRAASDPLAVIDDIVAAALKIRVGSIHTLSRRQPASMQARQLAMHLARAYTTISCAKIARHYGLTDHTTVLYAARCVQNRFERGTLGYDLAEIKSRTRQILSRSTAAFQKGSLSVTA